MDRETGRRTTTRGSQRRDRKNRQSFKGQTERQTEVVWLTGCEGNSKRLKQTDVDRETEERQLQDTARGETEKTDRELQRTDRKADRGGGE